MNIFGVIKNTGTFILNRGFGVMTKRQAVASAYRAGRALFEASQQGKTVTAEIASSIFAQSVPKGIKIPPILSTNEEVKKQISKGALQKLLSLLPGYEKTLNRVTSTITGNVAAYANAGKRSFFYIPHGISSSLEQQIVGLTHEFTHFGDFGTKGMLGYKLRSNIFKNRFLGITGRLLGDLGLIRATQGNVPESFYRILQNKKIVGYLRSMISEEMQKIPKFFRKQFLKYIKESLNAETLAYNTSGILGRRFGILGKDRVHTSELFGKYLETLKKAVEAEEKSMKIARKAKVKLPKVPKRKFRIGKEVVMDKHGNLHKKTIRYSTTYRENPKPACLEKICNDMKTQGENLYKVSERDAKVVSEETVSLKSTSEESALASPVKVSKVDVPANTPKVESIKVEFVKL